MKKRNLEFDIVDGRIKTPSLEVHIVDHCNLKCAECCSLSPFLPRHFVKPENMQKDLELATAVLSPASIKIVGGEPLLHPNIIECLQLARPMAKNLSVTTNAILLGKMKNDFWKLIDAITISLYPSPKLDRFMDNIHTKATLFDVSLNIKKQTSFVQMLQWHRSGDTTKTSELFENCWLRERCHIVDRGRFYQCTRPPHLHTLYDGNKNFKQDGLLLHKSASLVEEMYQYLTRSSPLESCFYCKGGDAKQQAHKMLSINEINHTLEHKL